MPAAIEVKVKSKTFIKADYATNGLFSDALNLDIDVTNNATKDVSAFQGSLTFSDLFGTLLYNGNLKYDDPASILAGHTIKWPRSFQPNQFIPAEQEVATAPLEKLVVVWKAKTVIFTDGTKQTYP